MKKVTVEEFAKDAAAVLEAAQRERVIVTRKGKAIVMLLGLENKDAEDLAWERDEPFWRMVRERRKEETIPLAEVKKRLGLDAKPRTTKKPAKLKEQPTTK